MQILDDVFWIGAGASNVYLCRDADGLTLVDAAMPRKAPLVFDVMDKLGFPPESLRRILLTHSDVDHTGSLAELQRQSGAIVLAGPETARLVVAGRAPEHLPGFVQALARPFNRYTPVLEACVRVIRDGDTLPVLGGLLAIATPGHCDDHFSFYNAGRGLVFAGDALKTRGGRVERSPKMLSNDQAAADASARRLLDLDPVVLACGHGAPLTLRTATERASTFGAIRRKIGQ